MASEAATPGKGASQRLLAREDNLSTTSTRDTLASPCTRDVVANPCSSNDTSALLGTPLPAQTSPPGGCPASCEFVWQLGVGLRKVAPLALLVSMVHFFAVLEHHLFMTYLYSRVQCCEDGVGQLPRHWDVTDPPLVAKMRRESEAMGVALREVDGTIGACDLPSFPRNSSLWTMSARCNNKAFVEESAQKLKSNMLTTKKLLCLFIAPLVGAASDVFGRGCVLRICCLGLVASTVIYASDAWAQGGYGGGPVIAAGCLMGCSLASMHITIIAAIGSCFGDDSGGKARAFVALGLISSLQGFIVEAVSYWYLHGHHTNHAAAWGGLTAMALLNLLSTCCCLQDGVLGASEGRAAGPAGSHKSSRRSFSDHLRGLCLVFRNPVLLLTGCVHLLWMFYHLGMLTTYVSYGSLLGVRLEDMVFPRVVVHIVSMIFPVLLTVVVPYLDIWSVYIAGHVLQGIGYLFCGPYAVLVDPYKSMFFTDLAIEIGKLMTIPAEHTIVSQLAGERNQGSCQAALVGFGSMGGLMAVPLYNRVLFDATATGLDKIRCPMMSLLVASVASALACLAKRLDYVPGKPVPPESKDPYSQLGEHELVMRPL